MKTDFIVRMQAQNFVQRARVFGAQRYTALVYILCIFLSLQCQTAFEPQDVIPQGGFNATVLVRSQANNPINGARVQWIITQRGVTQQQIDAAFNSASGAQSGISGSAGRTGLVQFTLPVPIAQNGVMVLFKTTPPPGSQFQGIQKNGNARIDTLTVCGDTFLEIVLQTQQRIQCVSGPQCQDIEVTIEPPVTQRDTVGQGDFVQTDGPITITSVTGFVPNVGGVSMSAVVLNAASGQSLAIPATVAQGVPYRINFVVDATNATVALDTTFIVTIAAAQNGAPCWNCTFRLRVVVKQQLNCACPVQSMRFTAGPDTVCVGNTALDTVKNIRLTNSNTDCGLLIRLNKSLLIEPLSEVFVSAMNSTTGDEILLNRGSTLNTITINFQPQTARTYNQRFVFDVFRQTTNGLVKCDSAITILYGGVGGTPTLAVDSANSSVLVRRNNVFVPDTLKQCTIHPNPRTGSGTACLRNDGTCPLTVDLGVLVGSSIFSIDSTTVTIPPKKSTCVRVTFKPSNSDVYPNGRCNPDRRNFSGLLRATSNFGSATIPLLGFADLDVQCAGKAAMISPQFGAKDAAGTSYFITLDILPDNTITNGEQVNGLTDSVKIYVKQIITTGGPPNDANVQSAVLSTGQFQKVNYYLKANMKSLPMDICQLFNTLRCPDPVNALTDQPVVEGDVLLFEYKGSYGIMWIKKLAWSDHTANALPQVEGLVCYPFN